MKNPDMTIADRVRFAMNPVKATQRVMARIQHGQLMKLESSLNTGTQIQRAESRWRGASNSLRALAGWRPPLGSGRSDNNTREREFTAARSQDAYRNHLVARAAITRVRTNVVGTGLVMHPDVDAKALGITEEAADALNEEIANAWALYYDDPNEVDIEGTLDGSGLQSLAEITAMLGGDCWASTPMEQAEGGIYELKVQLIDYARVCNLNNGTNTANLVDGVELSNNGKPIAIHVRRRHPDDKIAATRLEGWDRLEIYDAYGKRRIFQIWNDKDRIGVTRGMSYLAPILEPLQVLEQYSRSELLAAVVSSMFTVFIKKTAEPVDDKGNPLPAIVGQTLNSKGTASDLAMAPASIVDLGPNEEAQFADPSRPNSNYDAFFMSIVRQIGAALEIPLDELLLNYQASYSAARAAMLQAWRMYQMRRWWLVQQFCQPHYRLWFDEAVARGHLTVSDYADPKRRLAYTRAIWIGPARGAMQEKDEVDAARARIDAGLSNETIETAQMMGENWRTVYGQRRRELKQREKDGMMLTPAPGAGAAAGGPPGAARKPGESEDEARRRKDKEGAPPVPPVPAIPEPVEEDA